MADTLFDPKQHGADLQRPQPYQRGLNSDAGAGPGPARVAPRPEKDDSRTAYDVKEARLQLVGWTDDELRQIPLMPVGARLQPGATYVDLREPARREFTATDDMQVPIDAMYVPKSEVDYRAWNRLQGIRTAERIAIPTQAGGTPR
jgi:hypothetical protein